MCYFSGIGFLRQVISPYWPGVRLDSAREFGLLENLQNVCLLVAFIAAAYGVKTKPRKIERAALVLVGMAVAFVFFEEIDYGLHYYEFLTGIEEQQVLPIRNVHNVGPITDVVKRCTDLGIILFFVIAPLAFAKSKRPLVRYIVPDRFAIMTAVSMVIVSKTAHLLEDAGVGGYGTLYKNISEFRELLVYYLAAVCLGNLVLFRSLDDTMSESRGHAPEPGTTSAH